ncbi:MAG: alpha/beta hydrolase [Candidatus Amesbacteria bacterium]|nr:alpha/beta hydrolase [Candidatus Amesbacteria bacterium]
MNKVIIVHGLFGSPNGNWKPWLMTELEKDEVYASSIMMPNSEKLLKDDWIAEVAHQVELCRYENLYLVGHSLGATTIMRYLESPISKKVSGVVLVAGPCKKNDNRHIDSFLEDKFDFEKIKTMSERFLVIHSDNDPYVPLENAQILSRELEAKLVIVPGGGHFNSASGFFTLPQCLEELKRWYT